MEPSISVNRNVIASLATAVRRSGSADPVDDISGLCRIASASCPGSIQSLDCAPRAFWSPPVSWSGRAPPVVLVLGDREAEARTATVRRRGAERGAPQETLGWDDLAEQLAVEVRERRVR